MINESEISLEDHLYFIDLLATKTDKCYFLVQKESLNLGVINLTLLPMNSAELGIYADPKLRGVGSTLMSALIEHAATLGISRLIAHVFPNNVRALDLYKKFDFTEIKQTNDNKMLTLERAL